MPFLSGFYHDILTHGVIGKAFTSISSGCFTKVPVGDQPDVVEAHHAVAPVIDGAVPAGGIDDGHAGSSDRPPPPGFKVSGDLITGIGQGGRKYQPEGFEERCRRGWR